MLFRLSLEEIHAGLAQGNRDLDVFLLEDEFLGWREEILDHAQLS